MLTACEARLGARNLSGNLRFRTGNSAEGLVHSHGVAKSADLIGATIRVAAIGVVGTGGTQVRLVVAPHSDRVLVIGCRRMALRYFSAAPT